MNVAHLCARVGGRGSCRGTVWEGVDVVRGSEEGGPLVMRTCEGSRVGDGKVRF